ncbi:unnamed protein product [Rhizophagus irregularis]|nr:unnamed protein product [Rhizophagus irregularis]
MPNIKSGIPQTVLSKTKHPDFWTISHSSWEIESWDNYYMSNSNETIRQSHNSLAEELKILKRALKPSSRPAKKVATLLTDLKEWKQSTAESDEKNNSPKSDEKYYSLRSDEKHYSFKKPSTEPNPFVVVESDDEEFDAIQTIVGGASNAWVVDGINIRQRLSKYQETGIPKTRPEYFDVIFFNSRNGFLKTLEENVVEQMIKDIEEEETTHSFESNVNSLLDEIIVRQLNQTKENINKLQKLHDTFEEKFAIFFVNHM